MRTSSRSRPVDPGEKPRQIVSLNAFLTGLIWLCVLPLVILAVYLAVQHVRTLEDQRDREAANQAANVARSIDRQIGAQIAALQMLSASPLVDEPPRLNEFYEEALAFHESFGGHVLLADVSMQMIFNTRVPFGTALPKLPVPKGRAAAPTALATGKPSVGDMFFGPVAKESLVAVVVPLTRENRVKFLLAEVIETRQLQKSLNETALPAGWSLTVFDGEKEAMARSPWRETAVPSFEEEPPERFSAQSALSRWSVVLEVPRHIYRTPIVLATAASTAAILAATLLSLVGGRLAGRRLARLFATVVEKPSPQALHPVIAEIEAVRSLLEDAATARRAAESIRQESEQRFRQLFDVAPVPLCFIDKDGMLVSSNARFEQTFGYSPEEVPSLSAWRQLVYPDPDYRRRVMETWDAAVRRARENRTDIEPSEFRVTCKDGEVLTVVISGTILGDSFLATFFDITQRKRTEEALRESEEHYRSLFDNMLNGYAYCRMHFEQDRPVDFTYLKVNRAFEALTGLRDVEGKQVSQVIPGIGKSDPELLETYGRVALTGNPEQFETYVESLNMWFSISVYSPKKEYFVALFDVITERKLAEQALKRSEERLRWALHAAKAGTWEWDLRTNENFWSAEIWELYGLQPHDCDSSYEAWLQTVHPDDREQANHAVLDASKKGSELNAEWRVHGIGDEERWLMSRGQLMRDPAGQPIRYIGIAMDITERHRAMEALRNSLDEKVALLREVHHRVKNNLQVVASLLGLQATRSSSREAVDILQDTRNRVKSMAMLHEALYRSGNLARINFAGYVKDLCGQLLLSFGPAASRIKLENRITAIALPLEHAVPCGLIVNELVSNAFKHGFPGGRAGRVAVGLDQAEGGMLVLSVRDDGVGLPPDPGPGGSSTLGLQLVSRLAGQLGGRLRVEPSPGSGAAFSVIFPIPEDTFLEGAS